MALAYGKINLTLDILRRREDGYHDLCMVMQSVSVSDRLSLTLTAGEEVEVCSDLSYLPSGRGNIVGKAAAAFFRETGLAPRGVRASLEKTIPVCAGMAGGSSDAAAALRLLRDQLAPQLSDGELRRIGESVGSDVPFCLLGGTALAEGRGERLTPLPPLPPCSLVLCKPGFPISTPELFAQVQVRRLRCHPDTGGMCAALAAGDLTGVARRLYNVFEDVLPRRCREVFELKNRLMDLGALGVSMTGSGPTVFGIFDGESQAAQAAQAIERPDLSVYLARPVGEGMRLLQGL